MANSKGTGLVIAFTILAFGASAFFIAKALEKPKPAPTPPKPTPTPVKKKLVGVIGDIPEPEIVKGRFDDKKKFGNLSTIIFGL